MTGGPFAPRDKSPFSRRGKVPGRAWQATMDEALGDAAGAGFRVTTRSRPDRVYVQRDLWTAATISQTPGGVIVKPAWTTAQVAVVVGVLALLFLGVCGCPAVLVPIA